MSIALKFMRNPTRCSPTKPTNEVDVITVIITIIIVNSSVKLLPVLKHNVRKYCSRLSLYFATGINVIRRPIRDNLSLLFLRGEGPIKTEKDRLRENDRYGRTERGRRTRIDRERSIDMDEPREVDLYVLTETGRSIWTERDRSIYEHRTKRTDQKETERKETDHKETD